jgi:hypothetical protein
MEASRGDGQRRQTVANSGPHRKGLEVGKIYDIHELTRPEFSNKFANEIKLTITTATQQILWLRLNRPITVLEYT